MSTSTHPPSPPDDSPALDLCGRTLGDFRILRKLGQGGMGQVYLAEQVSLHRNVALKVLRPEMAASPQALARFRLEAEAVARITHANIVQVYVIDQAEGMLYMALEYVEGRNLREYVARKGPPDLTVALSIMRQVASALQRAGELGVVHRDIKPENILLTRKGEVKVADFGLSRCLEGDRSALNLTQTGVTMGTPLYMSPEQVEGKPVDPRTDIYSFGVTCYFMLAGHPPFRGSTPFEVAVAHVQKQPERLADIRPDLPEALCNVIHKMLAKDPAQRQQTGRDLLRDVARVREGLSGVTAAQPAAGVEAGRFAPPPALPESGPSPAVADARRAGRGWLAAGVVLSLLGAAVLGAAAAWRERGLEAPLPGGEKIRPADAGVAETVTRPEDRERALRLLVDQALSPPKGKTPEPNNVAVCMQLGLLYLDENRLEEAEGLFKRLEGFASPKSFQALGKTGRAVVLAVRNRPKESNELLKEVFPPSPLLERKGKVKLLGLAAAPVRRYADQNLGPVQHLLDGRRGRDWLARARWYNHKNALPESEVPAYLAYYLFPLREKPAKVK